MDTPIFQVGTIGYIKRQEMSGLMDNKDFSTPKESGLKFSDIEHILENTHYSKQDKKGPPKPIILVDTNEPKYDGYKIPFDWMIFWMCLGFATSFILGYIACLIRSL